MLEQYQRNELAELVNDFSAGTASGYFSDRVSEYIDGLLPIYNHDIIREWSEIPSNYTDEGASQYGLPSEPSIIQLMLLDLHVYYSELVWSELHEYGKTVDVEVGDFN